jgi:hypothetical protein
MELGATVSQSAHWGRNGGSSIRPAAALRNLSRLLDWRRDSASTTLETPIGQATSPDGLPERWVGRLREGFGAARAVITGRELLVGAIIAILTWPIANAGARIGLDPSWIVALHLAARQGLLFGNDIMFTFGPLGFLGWPDPYIAWTSAAALLFVGTIHFTACVTLLHLARQSLGLPKATLFVLLTAFAFPWIAGWRLFGVLLFVAVATALYRRVERPTGSAFALAIGVAVGFAGLGKINVAIVGLVIATIGVAGTARRPLQSLGTYCVAVVATIVLQWLATGQRLADLPAYVHAAIDLSVGYSQSMGGVDPQTEWTAGVALLVTIILVALFWRRTSSVARRDLVILSLLTALTIVAEFKAGFTRAGVGVTIYLATLLSLWPVVAPRTRSWNVAAVPIAGMLAAFFAIAAVPIAALIDPVGRVSALESQVGTALFHRGDAARATAASLREQYALPADAVRLLAGRTVHVEPWETAVMDAYPEFRWAPEPVFQAYSAYTPRLDRLNADRLAGAEAPEAILWITPRGQALSIDGRGLWFDAPLAKIEMVCRYVPLGLSETWQILGRVADRCGQPIAAGTVTTIAGAPATLPSGMPEGIVTVRIVGVASDLLSRLDITITHGASWFVSDGASARRIPLGTAAEPNIIGSTVDSGYRGALSLSTPPATMTIGPEPGAPGIGTPLTLEFEVIPLIGP